MCACKAISARAACPVCITPTTRCWACCRCWNTLSTSRPRKDVTGTYFTACQCPIFESPSQKVITWHQTLRNIDNTRISKSHISVLLEARVTWSGMLIVMCCAYWYDMTLTKSTLKVKARAMTAAPSQGLLLISFSESYHMTSNFAECQYYSTVKEPYFCIDWG